MKTHFDRRKSLQELEGRDWGAPATATTSLVARCLRLRRKPLRSFTVQDLLELIEQNISLHFLMPLAIEQLERCPLTEAIYYAGDLLLAALRVETVFWLERPDLWQIIDRLAAQAVSSFDTLDDIDRATTEPLLNQAVEAFHQTEPPLLKRLRTRLPRNIRSGQRATRGK